MAGVAGFERTMYVYNGFQKKILSHLAEVLSGSVLLIKLAEQRVQNNSACERLADANNVTLKD